MTSTVTLRRCVAVLAAAVALLSPARAQAQGTLMPNVMPQFGDANLNPLSSGKLCVYEAGSVSATPDATTYTDVGLLTPNSNPVILDGAGRPLSGAVYLTPGQSYKFVLRAVGSSTSECTTGAVQWTRDHVPAVPTASGNVDVTGLAGESFLAGACAYLADGSGSTIAGQWYNCDASKAYSSTLPEIGMALVAITSGDPGQIRLAGTVTGLTSLSPGAEYYVGTLGAITTPAPAGARHVGHADTSTTLVLTGNPPPTATSDFYDDFRLTATTATCVTTTDVTALVTLFWTPCTGNRITLPDSTGRPTTYTSAELSIAVPATTSQMYDVFVFASSGVPTLELLAWTNDTTRATALVRSNGRWTKTGDSTRLYVGSVRTTTVSGQTEDSVTKRYIWNYYNRVPRQLSRLESTATWNYTTATIRQANAAAANQVDVIVGIAEVPIDLVVTAACLNGNSDGAKFLAQVGIGEDSTSTFVTGLTGGAMGPGVTGGGITVISAGTARLLKYPAIGRHFYSWNEWSQANGTTTWHGAPAGPSGPSGTANGLSGQIPG